MKKSKGLYWWGWCNAFLGVYNMYLGYYFIGALVMISGLIIVAINWKE